jgi:hypothetical protein
MELVVHPWLELYCLLFAGAVWGVMATFSGSRWDQATPRQIFR